jgi:hypothetical protein
MTPEEAKMIEKFRRFSGQDQELLLRLIQSLLKAAPAERQRAEVVAPPNNIVKFPLKQTMRDHPYLNGFGWTERVRQLERLHRRIDNTVAALKRRKSAIPRAWRIEMSRYRREQDEGGAG